MALTDADRVEIAAMISLVIAGDGKGSLARVLEDQNAANYIRLKAALKAFIAANAPATATIPPLKATFPGATVSIPPVTVDVEPK